MSDDTTAETPTSAEPQPAAPVVDARTSDAVSEPAPASADTQELIEQGETGVESPAASQPEAVAPEAGEVAPASEEAAPVEGAAADDWSVKPESVEVESKSAKRSRAKATEAEGDSAEGVEEPEAPAESDEAPAGVVAPAEVPGEPPPPESKKKWYAIKVQSGREDTIKAAILRKVAIEGLEDVFGQIMVPVDKIIEKRAVKVKDKKTGEYTTVERKVERKVKKFQGYIFAELEFNDRLLYLIRETSGVGDFLKLRPRPNDTPVPEPMTDAEVKQMLGEKVGPEKGGGAKVKVDFEKGDRVRIKEGSFKDTEGEVKDVILPKDPTDPPKVMVTVTFWGRPLDVELEYWQVAKA